MLRTTTTENGVGQELDHAAEPITQEEYVNGTTPQRLANGASAEPVAASGNQAKARRRAAKRKLSKRKDPEANVEFYISAGYPTEGLLYYLRGLANVRLAEMSVDEALREPIRLEGSGRSPSR